MKKKGALFVTALTLFLNTQSVSAAIYDWGMTGVADSSRVTGILQLTNNSSDNELGSPGFFRTSPWNVDGSWIVYEATDAVTGADICKIHAASGNFSCLTGGFFSSSDHVNNPSFGTDNRIYFSKNSPAGNEIWRMNSDGSNKENLTLQHGGMDGKYVKISPDGQWIAFISGDGIWVSKSDGTALSPSSVSGSTQVVNPQFSWSPDSQWIVYQGVDGGNRWIYKVRRDGTENQALTKPSPIILGQHTHLWPAWSPDGNKIAFVWSTWNGADTDYTIQTIDEEGDTLDDNLDHANTASPDWINLNSPLSWSPDSQHLTYAKKGVSNKAIFIVNVADSSQKRQLTTGYEDNTPIWSPAGNRILFTDGGPG